MITIALNKGIINPSSISQGSNWTEKPSDEEKNKGGKILRTLHSNLERMIINHGLEVDKNTDETAIEYPSADIFSSYLHPMMKKEFVTGKLELVSEATIASGETKLSSPTAEICMQCQNVFLPYDNGYKSKILSFRLPILTEDTLYGKIRPFLLKEYGLTKETPSDKIVTPHIRMIVKGFMPIFDFFSGETGWNHYISNQRINPTEGFSLTMTSEGKIRKRITVIEGDTECKNFKVTHRGNTSEIQDFVLLKENIHEYLNTPQNMFFARYQSLTERVARLKE